MPASVLGRKVRGSGGMVKVSSGSACPSGSGSFSIAPPASCSVGVGSAGGAASASAPSGAGPSVATPSSTRSVDASEADVGIWVPGASGSRCGAPGPPVTVPPAAGTAVARASALLSALFRRFLLFRSVCLPAPGSSWVSSSSQSSHSSGGIDQLLESSPPSSSAGPVGPGRGAAGLAVSGPVRAGAAVSVTGVGGSRRVVVSLPDQPASGALRRWSL